MANYDPQTHHRHSVRLPGHDYAGGGVYFLTICAHAKKSLFGRVVDGQMRINRLGRVVQRQWSRTIMLRPRVQQNAFVVMPNHVHAVVSIQQDHAGTARRAPTPQFGRPMSRALSTIVRSFKSAATKQIRQMLKSPGIVVWQRNYYEHIVRSDDELSRIRWYVQTNPERWHLDLENPDRTGQEETWPWLTEPAALREM